MRKHAIAAAVVAAVLAPGIALAAQPAVPAAGSLWVVGSTPVCQTVTTPPQAVPGAVPILVGQPGQPDQWCWAYAYVGPAGTLRLPGGIPGERLSPTAYSRQTGSTVTVVYQSSGAVVVYLS